MRSKRPREEILQSLGEQRQALAASCQSFDSGNEWEAARLATTVFTLLHDDGRSIVSVLTQLGSRAGLRFISTGEPYNPKNLLTHSPLVFTRVQAMSGAVAGSVLPKLDKVGAGSLRRVQFPTWWETELIYKAGDFQLTRKRLIFALRHQDGGGHVGELTDESYVRMKTRPIGFVLAGSQDQQPLFIMKASMRQIAWELTETLKQLDV